MTAHIDPKLQGQVEKSIRKRFPDSILEGIEIAEGFDVDGDKIVNVIILLNKKPEVSQVSGLTQKLWAALSRENFGFPILSFRTLAENARLSATA